MTIICKILALFFQKISFLTFKFHYHHKKVDFDLKKAPESRFFKLRDKYFANEEFKKENIIK